MKHLFISGFGIEMILECVSQKLDEMILNTNKFWSIFAWRNLNLEVSVNHVLNLETENDLGNNSEEMNFLKDDARDGFAS